MILQPFVQADPEATPSPETNLVHLECTYILNVLLTNVRTLVGPEIKQRTYFS
jgi:hypothetical protein